MFSCEVADAIQIMVAVASGSLTEADLASWFRERLIESNRQKSNRRSSPKGRGTS
jgi:hypothetical protein